MLPKPDKIHSIYLDHAATTYTDSKVISCMKPYYGKIFANPSSLYGIAREANSAINQARRNVANILHALPENIIFTSGGSESDNTAIYGIARAHEKQGRHIISIAIEHHAVLHPLEDLKKNGWEITYIKTDKQGFVNAEDVISVIRKDTALITIMYANNEIGVVEPIAEIGRKLLQYRKTNNSVYPFFHTDACQATGYLDLDVEKLHVDIMTINSSKIYGPKGVGALYIRRGVKIKPLILGGAQEHRLRAGTENTAGIVGFAKALELVQVNREKESIRVQKLRDYIWQQIQQKIPNVKLNGPDIPPCGWSPERRQYSNNKPCLPAGRYQTTRGPFGISNVTKNRLPNNLNVTFQNIEGEALLLYLDEYGIKCSTGSACTSESLEPSHVLTAIGLPYEYAHGSIRFSFGHCNRKNDVDYLMRYLPSIVSQLREMSPVNFSKRTHAKYKS